MYDFIPGQRCISNAESQLGLGTVLKAEHRTVTVLFAAGGETRTYARHSAPLIRVAFGEGDAVRTQEDIAITVDRVRDEDGLLTYIGPDESGVEREVPEGELDHSLQFNRPAERLLNGQIDSQNWFELRYHTLQELNRLGHSDLYGLAGCRTSLIPHQLYIAHEVANRYAPRVLLADEVGLGKTIEAGLILHHQLLTERAHRALIVVPETLVHQWLVEMLRRFDLRFRIFDEARLDAESADAEEEASLYGNVDAADADKEAAGNGNPFMNEQLVLCSLEFLASNPTHFDHCLQADWDLLVVDEAHHLAWSPDQASDEYRMVEHLAARTRGVLLLTATPEQLGKESHFARLRLLDPYRFPDFDAFVEEEKSYEPIAEVVEKLIEGDELGKADLELLKGTAREGDNAVLIEQLLQNAKDAPGEAGDFELHPARRELVEHLLDRHGTGRVLFRNTRAAVSGFPERHVFEYPLAAPDEYRALLAEHGDAPPHLLLAPELLHEGVASDERWTQFDPRLPWLGDRLGELQPEKVLVITANRETALDIAWHLKKHSGIHAAVFHEGLSIVERDRAAAFFADTEAGAQVLVCSEIGSEGRNFQFAHHLVLFDLPLNPDLLEQRIGRLDRIGQRDTIHIHVPWLEDTAQQVMARWYHEALSAFEHTCPAGHSVFMRVRDELVAALQAPTDGDAVDRLVTDSRALYDELTEAMHRGRDRLLEYNSCRTQTAEALRQDALHADAASTLPDYMERVFDCFGVDSEPHSENCLIIRPTDHMVNRFPGLPDDGMTITYSRDTALSFEDAHFLTWEHTLVRTAMDLMTTREQGNTALTAVKYRGAPAGTVLLECLFVLEVTAVEALQSQRYLPPTTIRVVIDERGKDHRSKITHHAINRVCKEVDNATAVQAVRAKHGILKKMVTRCKQLAKKQAPAIVKDAHARAEETLTREINRLKALQQVNPNVREDEIAFFEQQMEALTQLIDGTQVRLDAVRVIVVV